MIRHESGSILTGKAPDEGVNSVGTKNLNKRLDKIENKLNTNKVARSIRVVRKSLGLSMEEFASRIDDKAKSCTVSNWETGKNLPNNKRLKKIAELGEITVDELLNGVDETQELRKENEQLKERIKELENKLNT